jgi:hypothetical protein
MNTFFRRNEARKRVNGGHDKRFRTSPGSWITQKRVGGAAAAIVLVVSATACGGQSAASSTTPLASESASPSATPTPPRTAPASPSCITENATEKYAPKVFICTKSDAGKLLWMEESESKRVTDARAAAAAKVAAEKAAADKAAQEAAAKAAQEQAAAAAAAAAAAKAQVPVQPAAPAAPSGCDPNYAGGCVPIASDVDCAGGSGNGPAYVRGPVTVVGSDIYGLDRDGDGVGCE